MSEMQQLLKSNWERRENHFELKKPTAQELILSYTKDKIQHLTLLSDGCANSNYKIEFAQQKSILLRIYLRDKNALNIEVEIHHLLTNPTNKIPAPKILHYDNSCSTIDHPFAITEFIDGDLMRNIILSGNENDIADCAFSAGVQLNNLRKIEFDDAGFFEGGHKIRPFAPGEEYLPYVQSCLQKDTVQEILGIKLTDQLNRFVETNQSYLPNTKNANLAHADFDPSNMLVKKINGHYQISAILDWEFAFSGTYLFDIGLFLRYSHRLPMIYEEKFIGGITSEGDLLPKDWKKSAKLLDIISLLSVLSTNTGSERPKLNQDILSLLQYTVHQWIFFQYR